MMTTSSSSVVTFLDGSQEVISHNPVTWRAEDGVIVVVRSDGTEVLFPISAVKKLILNPKRPNSQP